MFIPIISVCSFANRSLFLPPHRSEVHEIEKRKNARRKRQVAKQRQAEEARQERLMQIMSQNPQAAMMMQGGGMGMGGHGGQYPMMQMPMYGGGGGGGGGGGAGTSMQPQADQSGNPYAPRDDRRY